MSTQSVIAAVQAKFAVLDAANFPSSVRPALYFDEAPQTDSSGAQVQPTTQGYAVIKHTNGTDNPIAFGLAMIEAHEIDIEFFYPSLGDCETAAEATRLNGGTRSQRLGFDYGTLPDIASPYTLFAMRPRGNEPSKAGLGKTGVPVHSWKLSYRIELLR